MVLRRERATFVSRKKRADLIDMLMLSRLLFAHKKQSDCDSDTDTNPATPF
jgi:hypothetical protein